jgi:UrcA family protein
MKTVLAPLAFAAAAFVGALAASPATAQESAAPARILVSYSDLDLGSQTGLRTLDRRIRSAVELACGPTSDTDPAGKNDVLQCRTETLAEARAQRNTALASAHAAGAIQLASRR